MPHEPRKVAGAAMLLLHEVRLLPWRVLFAVFVAGSACAATSMAESAGRAISIGQPTPPMRVVVLDARTIKDTDTGEVFKLYAIDVCALHQTASLDGQAWPCGVVQTAWLVQQTLSQWVVCTPVTKNGDTVVARCASSSSQDLSGDMLRAGLAVLAPQTGVAWPPAYVSLEENARKKFLGLWRSHFDPPAVYRASHGEAP